MPVLVDTADAIVAISGDDVYEDLFGVGTQVQRFLNELGVGTSLRMGMGWLDGVTRPKLIVLYTAMAQISDERLASLAALVAEGSGLLVLHSTSVFPTHDGHPVAPYDRAFALYGSRYVSHGPVPHSSMFEVLFDPEHELTAGLQPFEIDHEHYELDLTADTAVVAWREAQNGREPIVTVRAEGAGRVCYVQLGHDTRAIAEPGVRAILANAVHWLAPDLVNAKGNN